MSIAAPRTASMHTSDGCRLDATVWRPAQPGRYPVLLMRQPYGRAIASTLVFAHPAWYAAHGYIVAIQDVRGTGTSDGEFSLFTHEAQDGADAVAWAAALEGSTGRVGMYGFSYQANTQFLALAGGGSVQALAPSMGGWDLRTDWAWENGAFRLGPNLGWGLQMGSLKATHDGDREAAHALRVAAQSLPLADPQRTRPKIIRELGQWTHYEQWLAHPAPGPVWDSVAPAARLAGHPLDVPMLHVGGWYDQMLMGTLGAHRAASSAGRAAQPLVVGPWTHQPWGRRSGAVDCGPDAASPIDAMQLAWFDRHLRQVEADAPAGLTLFDMGSHRWRRFAEWPEVRHRTLFLGGDGRAGAAGNGLLRADAGEVGVERIVHDPWRPAPVMGGHGSAPAGMQDRAPLDDRADVAVFTAAPLAASCALLGPVELVLWVESENPSFDVDAVLSMVTPDGRAWTLAQGHARVDGGASPMVLPMRVICATVPAGHAVRLSLAGAAFPSYAVNPGTGAQAADFHAAEEQVITLAIRHGGVTASRLVLPEIA